MEGQIMKSIAIAATQVVLAVSIIVMGAILLAGFDTLPQRAMADTIGDVGRMLVGAVEIVAGLCLLLPRGQVIGAFLLALVTVGMMGLIIGRSVDGAALRLASPKHVTAVYSTDVRACERTQGTILHLTAPRERAI
jgi:hypothetical protein